MPAVTREQFQCLIQMSVDRVRATIIANHSDSVLIQKKYPNGVEFDNNAYMAILVEIYGEKTNIPDVFLQAPHQRISEPFSRTVCISFALDIYLIVDCLNSVDSEHLTDFNLSNTNLACRDRKLDVSLILDETPSVFMQFLVDPRGQTAIYLLLIGAFFLSMASLGTTIIGAPLAVGGIALGIYTLFATKKPGLSGGFSYSPVPNEVLETLLEMGKSRF